MQYDKRKQGNKGLTLIAPYPALGLLAGDRLEPTSEFDDIGVFCPLSAIPVWLLFWRSSDQSLAHHRNPLWDPVLGLTPDRCITVGSLHTLSLGLCQPWCKEVVAGSTIVFP